MRNLWPFIKLATALSCVGLLHGCVSEAEIAQADAIITALPTEISNCKFIKDLEGQIGANAAQARFYLKLAAAKAGATHVVDTHAIPSVISPSSIGLYFTGRAYVCPEGAGPKLYVQTYKLDSQTQN